jgi:hypothetical protein
LNYANDRLVQLHRGHDGIERFELMNDKFGFTKHSSLNDYHQKLDRAQIENFRVFSCIRNPWDRMISFYFSPHRGVNEWSRLAFNQMLENEVKNTEYYLAQDLMVVEHELDIHFLRFENLNDDFNALCKRLSLPCLTLPHRNQSSHRPYQEYYDNDLIELVRSKSQYEIEKFGYEFD